MAREKDLARRAREPAVRRAAHRVHPHGWSRRWMVTVLGGGMVVMGLLIATVTTGQMGGLFAWLLTGKGSPRVAGRLSQGDAPLAIVRLTVEGMTCYR
jgi:hypothetical protein